MVLFYTHEPPAGEIKYKHHQQPECVNYGKVEAGMRKHGYNGVAGCRIRKKQCQAMYEVDVQDVVE